jgi:hypothetical protein
MSDTQGHSPSRPGAPGQETPGLSVTAADAPAPSSADSTRSSAVPGYADRSYRSVPTLVSGVLMVALAIWFCGTAVIEGHGQAPWYGVAALVLLLPLVSAFTIIPCVRANPDRLLLRNPFRTVDVPWSEFESIQAALSVELRAGGRTYQVWAVPVSLHQRKRAGRRAMIVKGDGALQESRRNRSGGGVDARFPVGGPGLRNRGRAGAGFGDIGSDTAGAWADRTVAEVRELAAQAEGRPSAKGTVSVVWAWWIVAPTVVGAVAIALLAAVG